MKSILAVLAAAAVLSLSTTNLKADTLTASFDAGLGAGLQTVVLTPIVNGYQFTYVNTAVGLGGSSLLNSTTSVFTATYLDVLGTAGVLNVTDLCTNITVLGKPSPCQSLFFSFTNVSLPVANVTAVLGGVVNVLANTASFSLGGANTSNFVLAGVNVQGGGGTIGFGPQPPTNTPVPEPGTLAMMATGLIGAAGAVKRKFIA